MIRAVADPFSARRDLTEGDPVRSAIADTGASISVFTPRGVRKGTPQYAALQQMYGRATRQGLEQAIQSAEYQTAIDVARRIVEVDPRFEGVDPLLVGREIQKQVLERASSRARSEVTSALRGR